MKYKIDGIEVSILVKGTDISGEFKIGENLFQQKITNVKNKKQAASSLLNAARATIMRERGIIHPIEKEYALEFQKRFEPIKIND